MAEILGVDSLFAQMILAIGAALLVGNLLAWRKHRQGSAPEGMEGEFRPGRAAFLMAVGTLMVVWGVASLTS